MASTGHRSSAFFKKVREIMGLNYVSLKGGKSSLTACYSLMFALKFMLKFNP